MRSNKIIYNYGGGGANAPPYNLLDHPEVVLRPQSQPMSSYPPDVEARRILDSYSNRNIFEGAGNRNLNLNPSLYYDPGFRNSNSSSIQDQGMQPPPYAEGLEEARPLLLRRRQSLESSNYESTTMGETTNFELQRSEMKIGASAFWSIAAGITFGGCRILLKNVPLNGVDLTVVSSLIQIVLAGLFVTCCQCQRLWPKAPARNINKIFLVLHAFLFAISNICGIVVYSWLDPNDAEALISLMCLATPIFSVIIFRETIKLWKIIFIPLLIISMATLIKPPMIFNYIDHIDGAENDQGLSTIGLIAAILGVAILGSLACVAVFVTGPHVKNGLLIFYSGFASFLVAVLASREDHNQKVLSPDIMYIPFIYWILMSSFGLMMVVANAFLMKSIKTSSPNIAVCVTQASYVCLLFTVDAILKSEIPDILSIIGLAVLTISTTGIAVEHLIYRRLPNILQRCF